MNVETLDVLTPQVLTQGGLAVALGIAMLWNMSLRKDIDRLRTDVVDLRKEIAAERAARLDDRGKYAEVLTAVAEKNGALAHALERLAPGDST